MNGRWSRLAVAALVLPLTIPVAASLAQTQPTAPDRSEHRSPEMRARLFDGHMAMVRESLKLNDAQLKLWAPVEAELRITEEARQKARADRRARWQAGEHERLSPADRLDRASQRAAERATRVKALAEAFRPFYASLNDEQKAVAGVVLRPTWGGHGARSHRWSMRGPMDRGPLDRGPMGRGPDRDGPDYDRGPDRR
jgi:hypothetical protein